MKFGEKLKALRLERNLSQKALADLSPHPHLTVQLAVVRQVPPARLPRGSAAPLSHDLSPAPWASPA